MNSIDTQDILSYIDTNFDQLCKTRIDPWANYQESGFTIGCHDQSHLSYKNSSYTGKPRDDFWNHYISPYLQELCKKVLLYALQYSEDDNSSPLLALEKTEIYLLDAISKVFSQMAELDQQLLIQSGEKNPKRKSADMQESAMFDWLSDYIQALAPARPKRIERKPAKYWKTAALLFAIGVTALLLYKR